MVASEVVVVLLGAFLVAVEVALFTLLATCWRGFCTVVFSLASNAPTAFPFDTVDDATVDAFPFCALVLAVDCGFVLLFLLLLLVVVVVTAVGVGLLMLLPLLLLPLLSLQLLLFMF